MMECNGSKTTTWKDFIRRQMDVVAGTDFFSAFGSIQP
jgi:hypothetical protein